MLKVIFKSRLDYACSIPPVCFQWGKLHILTLWDRTCSSWLNTKTMKQTLARVFFGTISSSTLHQQINAMAKKIKLNGKCTTVLQIPERFSAQFWAVDFSRGVKQTKCKGKALKGSEWDYLSPAICIWGPVAFCTFGSVLLSPELLLQKPQHRCARPSIFPLT